MRYMIVHKTNAHWESDARPTKELIERVGRMVGELVQTRQLLGADGLRPSSKGVRVRFEGGQRTVTPGPFKSNGDVAGFAILKVGSIEEAVERVAPFAALVGDVELDIRPVTEAWDLGMSEKPAGLTTQRVMSTHRLLDPAAGTTPPSPELMQSMGSLIQEMSASGTLLSTEGFPPTSAWTRLRSVNGKQTVIDGPFAESKELIGGFIIIGVSSKDEALGWLRRYATDVGAEEVDLIPLPDYQ
ncbi:MAG TPA: YciI family protein [Povalibacter sp.]